MTTVGTKCVDKDLKRDKWFWSRLDGSCASIEHIDDADSETNANMIVFTFQVRYLLLSCFITMILLM